MTREEQLNKYLKERNIPVDSLEANSIREGVGWADETPNQEITYTKEELIKMGFSFDLNGDIRAPEGCYDLAIKYSEYCKQKLIKKACEYLEDVLYEVATGVTCTPDVMSIESTTMEDFINNFRKTMEE